MPGAPAPHRALGGALFFVSGATALGLEAAWQRALAPLCGAAHHVTALVLGCFMAGLAIGAHLAGRRADALRAPWRAYLACEAAVGLWAAGTFGLLVPRLSPTLAGAPLPARLLLGAALVVPPTVAMGASLPLLVAASGPTRPALRGTIARLYGLNLLGGVVGAAGVGFWLLPAAGVSGTSLLLGAIDALLLVFWAAGGASDQGVREPDTEAEDGRAAVLFATAVGFLSFALQIAWNRVAGTLLGSSAYTFSLVLAVTVAGLGTGGLAAMGESDVRLPWDRVARRLVVLAVAVLLGVLAVRAAPFLMVAAAGQGNGRWLRLVVVAALVAVPGHQVGALFPTLAARFSTRGAGHTAGRALLATTAGNVAGALAGGFVVLPGLGAQRTLTAAAVAAALLAVLAAARAGRGRLVGTAVAGAALGLAAVLTPRWDPAALSAGAFRVGLYRAQHTRADAPCGPERTLRTPRALYSEDGRLGTVVVIGHDGGPACSLYSLRVGGKAEGSVFVAAPLGAAVPPDALALSVGDLPTEILAGSLPALAGAAPGRSLVVGWGTGISVRALLEAGAAAVTVAEIEPAVIRAARLFDGGLADDSRVTILRDDARTVLAAAPAESFDVVVSQPSNPWVVGAANLFSREYFELVARALRSGGRALVWVQLYETDREAVRSLVATLASVFDELEAVRPTPTSSDLLLLAHKSGRPTTPGRPAGAARGQEARRHAGVDDDETLAHLPRADAGALSRFARGAPVSSDDRPILEYRVADRLLAATAEPVEAILSGLLRSD